MATAYSHSHLSGFGAGISIWDAVPKIASASFASSTDRGSYHSTPHYPVIVSLPVTVTKQLRGLATRGICV